MEFTTDFSDSRVQRPQRSTAVAPLDASARALLEELRRVYLESEQRIIESVQQMGRRLVASIEGRCGGLDHAVEDPFPAPASKHSFAGMFDDEAIYDDDDIRYLDNEPVYDQYDGVGEPAAPTLRDPNSAVVDPVVHMQAGAETMVVADADDDLGQQQLAKDLMSLDYNEKASATTLLVGEQAMVMKRQWSMSSVVSLSPLDEPAVTTMLLLPNLYSTVVNYPVPIHAGAEEMVAVGVGNIGSSDHALGMLLAALPQSSSTCTDTRGLIFTQVTAVMSTTVVPSDTSSYSPTTCLMEILDDVNSFTMPVPVYHSAGELFLYSFRGMDMSC